MLISSRRTCVLLVAQELGGCNNMARPLRIYVAAVSSGSHDRGPWKAVLLAENSSGKVVSEAAYPLRSHSENHAPPVDYIDASLLAILMALTIGRKHRARELIIYSDCPAAVDVMKKRRSPTGSQIGTCLQARALAYSYKTVQFHYSPYPAMSDLPVIAAGG